MPVQHSGGRGSISGGHLGGKDNGEAEKIRQGTEDEDSGWRTFGGLQAIPEDEKGQIKTSRGQLEPYAMALSPSPENKEHKLSYHRANTLKIRNTNYLIIGQTLENTEHKLS